MKSRILLYIPLALLFILSSVVFEKHARPVVASLERIINQSKYVRFPFEIQNDKIVALLPEATAAGMRTGDRLVGLGGQEIESGEQMRELMNRFSPGDKVVYTVERDTGDGVERRDLTTDGVPLSLTMQQNLGEAAIPLLFLLMLPATSFLLGFYVVFLRVRDPMAWVLLLLLLGIGSIALESRLEGTLVKTFQEVALNCVGIWMLLFGIYFPERLDADRRFPWAKWLLIAPLAILGTLNLIEQLGRLFSWTALWHFIDNRTGPFDKVGTILSMIAIGGFFAAMATKSATLENPDARRRLRFLYVGTTAALLPSLIVVVYRLVSGLQGGFFQLVPRWFAVYALLSMLLFPLTMVYVIVVQRAMDVSVVIRQGLQYALAKNGVLAIQIALSFVVILTATSFVSDAGTNRPQKMIFIAVGITIVFLLRLLAQRIKIWVDRRFFREAYNAEQILLELSDDVRTMVETRPLLETVATRISESLHVPQVSLLLREEDRFVPAYSLGFDTEPVVALSSDSRSMRKLGSNRHILLYDDMTEVTTVPTMSLSDREQLTELNAQVLLPMMAKNALSGVISLSPKLSEEPYTASDLRLLRSVASQTGIALENSRLTAAVAAEAAQRERLNTEIDIAREVQERLFPQELPHVMGLDYFGACRPALGVGGDYYDFLELPGGKYGFAIGDISGKGIGASLMMASLQASLRGQSIHFGDDLAGLMTQINGLLYDASTSNRYATFFYSQYDPATRILTYVNAGHNPPFLIRALGDVEKLAAGGAVVGMLPSMLVEYEQGEVELRRGDCLIGYTDGISEAMNPSDEEWGEDEMLAKAKTILEKSAAEMLPIIVAAADAFANGAKQHDDMTMIIVKAL